MNNIKIKTSSISATFKTLGAELTSLKTADGHEYLWQGDPGYWSGQSPLLFPIVGALPDDSYTLDGKLYKMKSHGFARKSEWEVESHTKNSLTFSLKDNTETYQMYPFRFKISVVYSIEKNILKVGYRVENHNSIRMPFQIGGHPAFNCPLESLPSADLKLSDYRLIFEKKENSRRLIKKELLTGETLPFLMDENEIQLSDELFDEGALIFRDLKSTTIKLQRKDRKGRSVKMSFPGFTHFGIWKKPKTDAPFICLEPWYGVDSTEGGSLELTDKDGIVILEPGSFFGTSYRIELAL